MSVSLPQFAAIAAPQNADLRRGLFKTLCGDTSRACSLTFIKRAVRKDQARCGRIKGASKGEDDPRPRQKVGVAFTSGSRGSSWPSTPSTTRSAQYTPTRPKYYSAELLPTPLAILPTLGDDLWAKQCGGLQAVLQAKFSSYSRLPCRWWPTITSFTRRRRLSHSQARDGRLQNDAKDNKRVCIK